jgi:aminopeptidase
MTATRDLNANFARKAAALEKLATSPSLMQSAVKEAIEGFDAPYTSAVDLVALLQQTQRLQLIYAAGLQDNAAALSTLNRSTSPKWADAQELPVKDEMQEMVGNQFLKAPLTKPGCNIVIRTQPYATKITETVVDGYVKRGELFDVAIDDVDWKNRMLNATSIEGAARAGDVLADTFDRCEKIISIGANLETDVTKVTDREKSKKLTAYGELLGKKTSGVDNFYTLTRVPTPADAQIDNMEYKDYLQLFFELCDQPWEAVTEAQEKLIEKFDKAKEVRLVNDDGTDLTLSIEGFTFANSVVKKNIPGGEIFSGIGRESLNGTLVSRGKFKPPHTGGIIENMTLRFENGKVVEAHAEKGEEHLLKALDTEPNARYVGELGIGTNPWLKQHVVNGLLVEKIGGSFHLALGKCYTYTEYDGTPVKMDNGNHADSHWDVTTMLKGNGGKMFLDGELIQDNGEFIGEEFRVFNEGWKALPPSERPDYWKNRLEEQAEQRSKGFAERVR